MVLIFVLAVIFSVDIYAADKGMHRLPPRSPKTTAAQKPARKKSGPPSPVIAKQVAQAKQLRFLLDPASAKQNMQEQERGEADNVSESKS